LEEAGRTGKTSARVAQRPRKGDSGRMEMDLQVLVCRGGKLIQKTVQRMSERGPKLWKTSEQRRRD
jgi:hypothetical protein